MKNNNEQFFNVLKTEMAAEASAIFTPFVGTVDSLASFFGGLNRKQAEGLFKKAVDGRFHAAYVLDRLREAGCSKPSAEELQTIEDALIVRCYNYLWAIALSSKCPNSEAFANKILGKQVLAREAKTRIDKAQSFLTANFKNTEQLRVTIDALEQMKKVADIDLPEKANRGYAADMRNSSKILKGKSLTGKSVKREALSPEQEYLEEQTKKNQEPQS